jgi:hypothetical protein
VGFGSARAEKAQGLFWVIRVGLTGPRRLPVYAGERTFSG